MSGIDNNTLLYLRGDSFKDLSLNPKAITNSSSTIKDNCYYINGSQQRVHFGNLTLSGDFTIETMIYMGQYGYQFSTPILTPGTNESTKHWLAIKNGTTAGNYVAKKIYFGTHGAQTGIIGSASIVTLNAWHHIALVRNNNSLMLFLDGVKEATVTYSNTIDVPSACFGSYVTAEYAIDTKFYNYRISNVARYTENFTPSVDAFTSVSVSEITLTDAEDKSKIINCNISKPSPNETVSKVEILLNNNVIQTYTSNYDSISYTINDNEFSYGDNDIEIRAYYYNNNYVHASTSYTKELILEEFEPIHALPNTASFDDVIAHLNRIKFANKSMLNNLKVLLEDKGLQAGENPRLSTLIMTVKELSNNNSADITEYINRITTLENEISTLAQSNATLNSTISSNTTLLYNKLVSKGITGISTSSTFSALVSSIDNLTSLPSKTYLYNSGDECTSVTGGWKGHQFDSSFTAGYYTKGTSYLEYGDNSSSYGYGGFITTKAIDLTNYTKLVVKHQIASTSYTSGYDSHAKVSLCTVAAPTIRTSGHLIDLTSIKGSSGNRSATETVIDISSRTGSFYIGVRGESGAYNNDKISARLHYIYLTN